MKYYLAGAGFSVCYGGAMEFDTLEEAQKYAWMCDSEGSGWEFDIKDENDKLIEHHLGY